LKNHRETFSRKRRARSLHLALQNVRVMKANRHKSDLRTHRNLLKCPAAALHLVLVGKDLAGGNDVRALLPLNPRGLGGVPDDLDAVVAKPISPLPPPSLKPFARISWKSVASKFSSLFLW